MADATSNDQTSESDSSTSRPSGLLHLLFVGGCWLLLPLVYFADYGWPGAPPRVSHGGDWIVLDFTGLMTTTWAWFAGIYTALTTLAFTRARQRPRKMSWGEYIVYAPLSVLGLIGVWFAYVALN